MKKAIFYIIVFFIFGCTKEDPRNFFIGEYLCNVKQTYYPCPNEPNKVVNDTQVIFKIMPNGEKGLKFTGFLNREGEPSEYGYIEEYNPEVTNINGDTRYRLKLSSNVFYSIYISKYISSDTLGVIQEDGHRCTVPVYRYFYLGKKIK